MTEDKRALWDRYRQRDETARKELIVSYLPLVKLLAKRIAGSASWANWEDLVQDGVIGLIKAIERFDPGKGTPFRAFATHYIRGAIFDNFELTRDMTHR